MDSFVKKVSKDYTKINHQYGIIENSQLNVIPMPNSIPSATLN